MNALQYDTAWQRYLDREMDPSEEAAFLARLDEAERVELHATGAALSALERLPRVAAPVGLADRVMAEIRPPRQSALARLRAWMERRPLLGWEFAGAALAASALFVVLAPLSLPPAGDALPQTALSSASSSLTRAAHAPSDESNALRFSLYAPQAGSVALVGDFNGWGSMSEVRLKPAGKGMWSVVVPLPSGRYQYAFLVDGQRWVTDPRAEQRVSDDFGRQNAVVTIL